MLQFKEFAGRLHFDRRIIGLENKIQSFFVFFAGYDNEFPRSFICIDPVVPPKKCLKLPSIIVFSLLSTLEHRSYQVAPSRLIDRQQEFFILCKLSRGVASILLAFSNTNNCQYSGWKKDCCSLSTAGVMKWNIFI